jgi:hypothetical protein
MVWRVAAVSLTLACLIGCDGATLVDGTVTNRTGNAIKGATVRLSLDNHRNERSMTDADGSFHVGLVHAPSHHVRSILEVVAAGFQPTTIELVGSAHYQCKVAMEPTDEQRAAPVTLARDGVCTLRAR